MVPVVDLDMSVSDRVMLEPLRWRCSTGGKLTKITPFFVAGGGEKREEEGGERRREERREEEGGEKQ